MFYSKNTLIISLEALVDVMNFKKYGNSLFLEKNNLTSFFIKI